MTATGDRDTLRVILPTLRRISIIVSASSGFVPHHDTSFMCDTASNNFDTKMRESMIVFTDYPDHTQ